MDYNKKEQLLDRINGLRVISTNASDTIYNRGVVDASRRTDKFFNEGLVPEVPQCVIDWYEENKDSLDYNLWNFIMDWDEQEPSDFHNWFNASNQAFKTIVNMEQFGYKLKQEKKYIVKMKGLDIDEAFLKFQLDDEYWYMGIVGEYKHARGRHTRKELENAGFGEVFNSPLFEVKEVE